MSRSAIQPWPTESWTASSTTRIASNSVATPCASPVAKRRSAKRAPGLFVLVGDKGCCPFPRTPFLANGVLPSLRSGQALLAEADHLPHTHKATVASLRLRILFLRNPDRLLFAIS